MPLEIKRFLQHHLTGVTGFPPAADLSVRQVGGGSINAAYQLSTKYNSRWFAKFNKTEPFPDLLFREQAGLALLRQQRIIRVPETIACLEAEGYQLLILEWIDEGPRTPAFWRLFGEQLAALHHQTAPAFGLSASQLPTSSHFPAPSLTANNYMGALPQDNSPSTDWVEFFIHRRLEPQINLAAGRGLLNQSAIKHFQSLYHRLPELFPAEPPALLHGDLWSGNFLCGTNGRPVLLDPAVYYGHRSVDLAMTTLFGGFASLFYEAYHHHYPFPPNHRGQWDICNLYPLLIHLNLFGESYLSPILNTIRVF